MLKFHFYCILDESPTHGKGFLTSQRSGSYRRAMEVRPNPTVTSSNDSLASTNSTSSTIRSTKTKSKKSDRSDTDEAKEITKKSKEMSAFIPVRHNDAVKNKSRTLVNGNTGSSHRSGLWTKPVQNKSLTSTSSGKVQERPGIVTGPPVASLEQPINTNSDTTPNSNFLNNSRPKGYNWVNSYFRNKSNRSDDLDDSLTQPSSEEPELKTNIQPKQNSFLRKVQGKRKVKT